MRWSSPLRKTWQGSLSHDGYANNVAKLTDNVARRFVDEKPF